MTPEIYDSIARYYRLLFEDWDKAVEREARRLDALFRPRGVRSVLDCTCGTGLQCIGLAGLGYTVTGCDNSPQMLRQARRNARSAGARLRWVLADARDLPDKIRGQFDAVISLGNSLSHMETGEDLRHMLASMHDSTVPGGWCLVGCSDYDSMMQEKPEGLYRRFAQLDGRWVLVHDKLAYGEQTVTATFTVLTETARGWREHKFVMTLRAWRRAELLSALLSAGFCEVTDVSAKGSVELLARKPA